MIELFKFKPVGNLPDPSPFCMKVETFLKMAELEYRNIELKDPSKGPKGKLPFIHDGAKVVGDSSLIIEYLIDTYSPKINHDFSKQQKAIGHSITKMLEERFYWIVVYSRWIDHRCWPSFRNELFGSIFQPIRLPLAGLMRKRVKRALHSQGIGRHSVGQVYAMGHQDLQAVSDILDANDFVLGKHPTYFDCSIHAFVATAIQFSLDTPLKAFGLTLPNLVDYNDRMNGLYYPV